MTLRDQIIEDFREKFPVIDCSCPGSLTVEDDEAFIVSVIERTVEMMMVEKLPTPDETDCFQGCAARECSCHRYNQCVDAQLEKKKQVLG